MIDCLSDSGCCIAGQTATLVPADRIMYSTRDITGTVENANFVTGQTVYLNRFLNGGSPFWAPKRNLEKFKLDSSSNPMFTSTKGALTLP